MTHPRNQAIAAEFLRIAAELEDRHANPYRIRAYRQAARLIGRLTVDVGDVARRGDLIKMHGIGKELARKVVMFCETGRVELHTPEERPLPPEVAAWLALPGLTPSLVHYLVEHLSIRTLDDLEALVRSRMMRTLSNVQATDEAILEGIVRLRADSTPS